MILVDNASVDPLDSIAGLDSLSLTHLRLDVNAGGSGGFNAGLSRILGSGIPGDRSELLWLLDSDVRVEPGALLPLLSEIESDSSVVAAGSALVEPASGEVFEVGGRIDPRSGEYTQPLPEGWRTSKSIDAQYLAACSLLVRRTAVEQAGLMADLFVNGDDVEWSLRLTQRTGGRLVCVPASRVRHPHPDKMRTWARYYAARNAFFILNAAASGFRTRLARGVREVGRALGQSMVGRDDLAELHLRGLEHARSGVMGPAPQGTLSFEAWRKPDDLGSELRKVLAERSPRGRVMIRAGVLPDPKSVLRALNAACVQPILEPEPGNGLLAGMLRLVRRFVVGPEWGVGVISARGRLPDWLCARVMITVAPEGFVVRRMGRFAAIASAFSVLLRGARSTLSLAAFGHGACRNGGATPIPSPIGRGPGAPTPTVTVVVLSYNRREALEQTLHTLAEDEFLRSAQVIVADNASGDGSVEAVRSKFPRVEALSSDSNRGVAGFNSGAARARGDLVLLLDDDARPDAGAIRKAVQALEANPALGAVALNPRHPKSGAGEWSFAERVAEPRLDWPVMGCGNLVRREVWERVGGYEEAFFLYRNDTDLAMKVLGAGYGVYFDPALVVWHDSPAAARKSTRWFRLATRNWIWVCRRHGRGLAGLSAAILGAVWAHKLAGLSPIRHWQAASGWLAGMLGATPALPRGIRRDGAPIRTLLRLRLGR